MNRVLVTMLLAGIATVGISTSAHAAGNSNGKIMLHALPATTKNTCNRPQSIPTDCAGYQSGIDNLGLYPTLHFVYLLAVNGSIAEGVAGVQCGISFNGATSGPNRGVDVYSWTLCSTLEFKSTGWPQNGGGNLMTWNTETTQCTTPPGNALVGAVAISGFFYCGAYTPDTMRITTRPVDGLAKLANCSAAEDLVTGGSDSETFMGSVGFGPGRPGINPCGRERVVAVTPSTWSNVKNLIGSN